MDVIFFQRLLTNLDYQYLKMQAKMTLEHIYFLSFEVTKMSDNKYCLFSLSFESYVDVISVMFDEKGICTSTHTAVVSNTF